VLPDGYFVILNPASSRGGGRRSRLAIEEAFRSANARFEIVSTERRGHAAELAERAVREGWSAVVAVGGDGVVHEAANGLVRIAGDAPSLPLGVIPVGSGNDFAKMLDVPVHRPADAVRRIIAAEPRRVDIGRVSRHRMGAGPEGEWYFTNGVGVGFDAQVATHARGIQRLRGVAIYAWALVKALRELKSPHIRVTVDGQLLADRPLILTTISNGPCHGGSFWLCPGARIDDGQLDVLVADARRLTAVIALLPRVVAGKHLHQAGVYLRRGTRVDLYSDERLPIHADGEIVADWVQEMVIEILPGKLTVLG
jgi:YegS/Rv2252/BmrU family lipid kinase